MQEKKDTLLQRIQKMERRENVVQFTGAEFEALVKRLQNKGKPNNIRSAEFQAIEFRGNRRIKRD